MEETWFQTSEQQDVLHSLRHVVWCIGLANTSPENWKWAIISFHSALQGALTCHLCGTMQIGAYEAKCGLKWLEYLQHDRASDLPEPPTKMASIGVLFQRVTTGKEETMIGKPIIWANDANRQIISVDAGTERAFKSLVGLRNDFAHFAPRGWSIELSGLPRTFSLLARFVSDMLTDGWAFRHLNSFEQAEMSALLSQLSQLDRHSSS